MFQQHYYEAIKVNDGILDSEMRRNKKGVFIKRRKKKGGRTSNFSRWRLVNYIHKGCIGNRGANKDGSLQKNNENF